MAHVIWKFEIPARDHFKLDLRLGAKVLSVQMQDGKHMLWVLIDKEQPERTFVFRPMPTGQEFNATGFEFAGTFQPEPGLVFHLLWSPT